MRPNDMSFEQLEDREQSLAQEEGKYAEKVELYREMHRRLAQSVRAGQEDEKDTLDYVEKKLVH